MKPQGQSFTPVAEPELDGPRNGPGLKPGLNMADTGGRVHTAKGYVRLGRQSVSGNDPKRNSMVSANASRKR